MEKTSPKIFNVTQLKNEVINLAEKNGFIESCYRAMLDYTIKNLQSSGLGEKYYGYHNIDHLLEIPLGTLLVGDSKQIPNLSDEDLKYLFVSAIFHDFEPDKIIDKPSEDNVLKNLTSDHKIKNLIAQSGTDFEIIKALILRTAYPWSGKLKENGEKSIQKCFDCSNITKNNPKKQEHFLWLGWLLSVIDRMTSYALGNFSKAMHVAKMNSHALGWHPDVLVQRSVSYFDDLTKNEPEMCNLVLKCLSKEMKENFMNNIQMFRELREQELKIQSDFTNKKLKFMIRMEQMKTKPSDGFVNTLQSIFLELPKPLRFNEENFNESLSDSEIILTTLRLNSLDGSIIGFAKGGPLENYNLRAEINDENYGKRNTIFLEPIALSMGYWGLGAGHKLRQSFLMQAHTMNYEYLTSFAFRDVISGRVNSMEKAEFVTKFDPERWDYFRVHL
ncbi:hypothetical protein AAA799O18_00611 [Marine Group I thaumarchaeote SCGC AAA799-O18]|nr:hypothetical protein AAA799O18_00611 [Marine Group I thaumarchaeote SCGC AAA799-O18]